VQLNVNEWGAIDMILYIIITNIIIIIQILLLDEKGEKLKEQLRKKVEEYLNRAEELKKAIAEQKDRKAVPSATAKGPSKDNSGNGEDGEDAETKKMQNALSSAILAEKPNVRWEDIAGLESAKEALKEAVILPIKFPHLFSGKRTPWKGILLYGVRAFLIVFVIVLK